MNGIHKTKKLLPEDMSSAILAQANMYLRFCGVLFVKGEKLMSDDCPQQDENPFLCREEPP